MSKRQWRIKRPGASRYYYKQMTDVGPMFAHGRDQAKTFPTAEAAVREMGLHWGFVGCRIELPDGKLESDVPESVRVRKSRAAGRVA